MKFLDARRSHASHRGRRALIAACVLVAASNALCSPALAQAWFGLPTPGPATGQVVDFQKRDIPFPAPPALGSAKSLAGAALMQDVRSIVGFSYKSRDSGDRLWGRLAGSPHTEASIDFVAASLRAVGIETQRVAIPFTRVDHPTAWRARLLANAAFGGGEDIDLRSAVPMESTRGADRAGGGVQRVVPAEAGQPLIAAITAPVIYVGDGSKAAIASASVKGKIAVYTMEAAPASFYASRTPIQESLAAGAVGVVSIYNVPGNLQLVSGSCAPTVPCMQLGGEDGAFLRALIERAARTGASDKLVMEISVTRAPQSREVAHALIAKIAGRKPDGENIVISAHSDAFFAGANDNASGVAVFMGLARHFARNPLRHDLYILLSAGHHEGTGGMAPLVAAYPDLGRRNIIAVNLEHIGQAGVYKSLFRQTTDAYGNTSPEWVPTNWDSPGREVSLSPDSAAIKSAWRDAAVKFEYTTTARFGGAPRAELSSIFAAGGAGIQGLETSPWFHSSGDTPETLSPETMQRVALFYLDFLHRMDSLSRADVWAGVPEKSRSQ